MATTFTVNLDDAEHAELDNRRDDHNLGFPADQRTTTQMGRAILREALAVSASTRKEIERARWRDVYDKASPADKAIMDAVRTRTQPSPRGPQSAKRKRKQVKK